jgi:hypothetical protein
MSSRLIINPIEPPQPPEPPVPPTPPNPVIPTHNVYSSVGNFITQSSFNRSSNNPSPNLLHGTYTTRNINPLNNDVISNAVLYLPRFTSGITKNIVYTKSLITNGSLSLVENYSIHFWIYPMTLSNMSNSINLITKGDASMNSYGEYTIQIAVDGRIFVGYTSNSSNIILRSNRQLLSSQATFVSIIKSMSSMIIYLNNVLDNQMTLTSIPTPTTNPVVIGSQLLNGYIDNIVISASIDSKFRRQQYLYTPTTYIFTFDNGKITYNGYNIVNKINVVLPINNTNAKFFNYLLENHSNGFIEQSNNTFVYFSFPTKNITLTTNESGNIYNKINVSRIGSFDFANLAIDLVETNDIQFKTYSLMDGYYSNFNGETYFFTNGIVYEYDNATNSIIAAALTREKVNYILLSITAALAVRYSSPNTYIFYSYFKDIFLPEPAAIQTHSVFIQKVSHFTIGNSCSLTDIVGNVNIGTFNFTCETNPKILEKQYSSERSLREEPIDIYRNIFQNHSSNSQILQNTPLTHIDDIDIVEPPNVLKMTPNIDVASYATFPVNSNNKIYIYNTNGMDLLAITNTFSSNFVNTIPVLENSSTFDFKIGTEMDLIDVLFKTNAQLSSYIVFNMSNNLPPGMYQLSIMSNTPIKIILNGKESLVNSLVPQHMVFHHNGNLLSLEIQFFYRRVTQITKLLLLQS